MSDTTTSPELLAALQAQLAALQRQPAATASPWTSAAPAPAQIVGVSVPIKVQTPGGSIRVYLSLPAEAAASPAALMAALESLATAGLPLDTWQPSSGSGDSWGRGSSGGGWNNNRGGFRR